MERIKPIYTLTDFPWKLTHEAFLDDFGVWRDSMEVIFIKRDGFMLHFPFFPKFKVTSMSLDIFPKDQTTTFSEKEYVDMLREMVLSVPLHLLL